MFKYLLGLFKFLFNPAVALFNKIDNSSEIDRSAHVYAYCQVSHSKMGRYSYIGRNSRLIYAEVGNFCSISGGAVIGMGTHTLHYLSTCPLFTEVHNGTRKRWLNKNIVDHPFEKVTIGNDVWIGSDAMVLGGINIGNGAIIGAKSLVTKDVPAYAIVGGVPAHLIRFRFSEDQIKKLEVLKWWEWSDVKLRSNIKLFQRDFSNQLLDLLIHENES